MHWAQRVANASHQRVVDSLAFRAALQDAHAPMLVVTRHECRALDWLSPAASGSGIGTCLPVDPLLLRAGQHDLPCSCSEEFDELNCAG